MISFNLGTVIAFAGTLGMLLYSGAPATIHTWTVMRSRPAVQAHKKAARKAHAVALKRATSRVRARRAKAKRELKDLESRFRTEKRNGKNAKQRNKRYLDNYASLAKAMTPTGPQLLVDPKLSLEDLIERVALDGLRNRSGFSRAVATSTPLGFELVVTCEPSLTWSQKTDLMAGLRQIRATLGPAWVAQVRFAKLGEDSIPVGSLASLDDRRLTSFMTTYYGTTAIRLPDPSLIGRHTGSEAVWLITNATGRAIVVDYFGASQGSVRLVAGEETKLELEPGSYHISASAVGGNVTPFSGQSTYEGGHVYGSNWVIETVQNPLAYRRWTPNRAYTRR